LQFGFLEAATIQNENHRAGPSILNFRIKLLELFIFDEALAGL